MSEQSVLYEVEGKVGIVALNRPAKLNALSMELRLELERVLRHADDDATPASSCCAARAAASASASTSAGTAPIRARRPGGTTP